MPDPDLDSAQADVDAQAQWGETHESRAIAKLVRAARRIVNALDNLRDRTKALEDRVKALEDAPPP